MEDQERGHNDGGTNLLWGNQNELRIEDGSPVGVREHRPQKCFWIAVISYVTLWWWAAAVIIMMISITQEAGGIFPYSFALTVLVQMATGGIALLSAKVVHKVEPPSLTRNEWMRVVAIGLIQGIEIGLTNKALQFLTVSSRTMINSTNVLFMMVTARLWNLEILDWRRLLACAFLVGGGMLQGFDHTGDAGAHREARLIGIVMQLGSMMLSSQRWALVQTVLQPPLDSALARMQRLQLMSRTMPITGLVLIPLVLAFEIDAVDSLLQAALFQRVLLIAVSLAAMTYAELQLVKELQSAVAFNVLATIHQIPIVLVGVIFQHNHVGAMSASGFALCLIGAVVYRWASMTDKTSDLVIGDGA